MLSSIHYQKVKNIFSSIVFMDHFGVRIHVHGTNIDAFIACVAYSYWNSLFFFSFQAPKICCYVDCWKHFGTMISVRDKLELNKNCYERNIYYTAKKKNESKISSLDLVNIISSVFCIGMCTWTLIICSIFCCCHCVIQISMPVHNI